MDKKNNAYYLGIDLCDTYAMVSFYQLNMEEPDIMVMKPERWQKRVRFSV